MPHDDHGGGVMFQTAIAGANEPRISVLADRVYEALSQRQHGTLVTYHEFRLMLFEDPQGKRCRSAILRAGKRLLREQQKLLVNVRGKGYQLAMPNEHSAESKRVQQHGRRRYRRALEIVVNAEMEKLSPQERQQVDEQANRMRLILAAEKNIAKATVLPSSGDIVIPSGKRLAALLTESAKDI
jgi:hypothetical protein